MTTSPFVRGSEVAWEATAKGVRRKVLSHGPDLMVVRVEFESGAVGALHHHPHRQATYVIAGTFDVTVGDGQAQLHAGDCFYTVADVEHGVVARERGVLLDVFTPVREDLLKPVS
jgi:quercetin dioxygenase-like cupin family protein